MTATRRLKAGDARSVGVRDVAPLRIGRGGPCGRPLVGTVEEGDHKGRPYTEAGRASGRAHHLQKAVDLGGQLLRLVLERGGGAHHWVAVSPVLAAASLTLTMLVTTSWVPAAVCRTLWLISCVAADCSWTAFAIVPAIALI